MTVIMAAVEDGKRVMFQWGKEILGSDSMILNEPP